MRQIRVVALLLGLGVAGLAAPPCGAAEPVWRHGTSLMGQPKYPAGFAHFDYVDPKAPKGGVLRLSETGTFDSFNPLIPKGNPAAGLSLVNQSLMTSALDEVATEYGEIAEAVAFPDDFSSVTYRLNPKAKWHDGTPITADDVVWSFKTAVELSPTQAFYYKHVKDAAVSGEREVTFTFDQTGNRELPQIVGQLTVLPRHWWEGTGPDGRKRSITETTLEPPLGSGPYRIKSWEPGRSVTYERVRDWWAADLPTAIGTNNFDEIRWEFFRDDTVELEAFKGDGYDVRMEATAKNWATAYDFPARAEGRVVLEQIPTRAQGVMVGFIPNLRRAKFQDPRMRLALSYTLDFEEMNRTLFFGQYERIVSYFHPTELASSGLPQGAELDLLHEAEKAGPIPAEVFTKPFANPVTADGSAARANLKEALRLFGEAGWVSKGGKLVSAATGEPLVLEFLTDGPAFERVAVRWRESLAKIGVTLTVRIVDSSQYVNRLRSHDYDLIYSGWAQSMSPGNEQQYYFGSASADSEGARNWAGIRNPAVDALIQKVIYAKDRAGLIAATRALDRVLLWNHYVIPGWTAPYTRMARWNRFSHPEPLPLLSSGFPTTWWFDAAKATKTGAAK
ncbi:ABC transporter substrate-binding protein [Siculibacillus lacustris]|uniref:ABC transporter substrate-binding protein n=1 Tax=Siculibacillus lacustris TaxID=1549641 RepID=A0A4Q9VMZ2_9HYPH|nr:extracellular solute-binding protein [Siculibacillus lacustris]TBW36445.1 ABC transporter substrate-binding protein [Siculibacillus lacustris]